MGRLSGIIVTIFLGLPAAAAPAQDFGVDWIDRVTHELQLERGPLQPRPLAWTASAGAAYYYDDNVFLEHRNRDHDSIVIPFVRGRLDYTEPHFDASADLLFDYKVYAELRESRDDEERFFGRAQYADAGLMASLAVLARNESDPLDALFLDRVGRLVLDALPKVGVDLTNQWALEAGADFQLVRFQDDSFADTTDNKNVRADLSVVYRSSGGFDTLLQGGYLAIDYTDHVDAAGNLTAPPDVSGFYVRGGARGELVPGLRVEGLAGYTKARSKGFSGATLSGPGRQHGTTDASVHVRWEATPLLTLYADYTRLVAFGGGLDPFQVVDRSVATAEVKVTEAAAARARLQFDRSSSALGLKRDFFSAGASASYRIHESLVLEGGATWRWGETTGEVAQVVVFHDTIVHLGAVLTY